MSNRIFVVCILAWSAVLLVHSQRNEWDRQLCKSLDDKCAASTPRLGNTDDGVDALNEQCIVIRGPAWRNITRCQLVKATCALSIIKCKKWTCRDVEKVLQ